MFTPADIDDQEPLKSMGFAKEIYGKLVGDKGYISRELFQELFVDGIHLITKVKNNMKNCLMSVSDKILIRKRAVIESVNDELKNMARDIAPSATSSPTLWPPSTHTASSLKSFPSLLNIIPTTN